MVDVLLQFSPPVRLAPAPSGQLPLWRLWEDMDAWKQCTGHSPSHPEGQISHRKTDCGSMNPSIWAGQVRNSSYLSRGLSSSCLRTHETSKHPGGHGRVPVALRDDPNLMNRTSNCRRGRRRWITTRAYGPDRRLLDRQPPKFYRPEELEELRAEANRPVDLENLNSYDWYDIPPHRIAQRPLTDRTSSRLLHLDGNTGDIQHVRFGDILHKQMLKDGDLVVLNDTKVIPARILGRKSSGGSTELLLDRVLPESETEFMCMIRSPPKRLPARVFTFADSTTKPHEPGAIVHTLEIQAAQDSTSTRVFRVKFIGSRRRLTPGSDPAHYPELWKELLADSAEDWETIWSADGNGNAPVNPPEGSPKTVLELLDTVGHLPLPSYIQREDDELDRVQYQTVFAENLGAMAAPTAGLHFDEKLLSRLRYRGVKRANVTLHVGLGTFLPIKTEDVKEHTMHSEYAEVSQETCDLINATKNAGGRVIAVGTTSVRTLEAACLEQGLPPLDSPEYDPGKFHLEPYAGHTDLFIRPGAFDFRCVDGLITNFHVNKSTLLMLVSAFGGYDNVKRAYGEALAHPKYRFFSYGDAMFINRQISKPPQSSN